LCKVIPYNYGRLTTNSAGLFRFGPVRGYLEVVRLSISTRVEAWQRMLSAIVLQPVIGNRTLSQEVRRQFRSTNQRQHVQNRQLKEEPESGRAASLPVAPLLFGFGGETIKTGRKKDTPYEYSDSLRNCNCSSIKVS